MDASTARPAPLGGLGKAARGVTSVALLMTRGELTFRNCGPPLGGLAATLPPLDLTMRYPTEKPKITLQLRKLAIIVSMYEVLDFLVVGMGRSFGVFYLDLMDRFQGSAAATAWVVAIYNTLRMAFGMYYKTIAVLVMSY